MTKNKQGPIKDTKARSLTERNGPITYSNVVPIFETTVNMDPKLPRRSAGEISPIYIGVAEWARPVDNPAKNLDIYSSWDPEKKIEILMDKMRQIDYHSSVFRTQENNINSFNNFIDILDSIKLKTSDISYTLISLV